MVVQDQGVGDGHALDISRENFGALGVDLIADQQTATCHQRGDLGGLAAGGGAEVQDRLAGLGGQEGDGGHGAGLLEVVKTGLVPDMEARPGVGGIVMAVGRPGDGVLHEGEAGEGIGLQGIEAQSHGPGPVQAAQIIVKFVAELVFQPGEKGFGEHRGLL